MSSFVKEVVSGGAVRARTTIRYSHPTEPYMCLSLSPGEFIVKVNGVKVAEWLAGYLHPIVKQGEKLVFSKEMLKFVLEVVEADQVREW